MAHTAKSATNIILKNQKDIKIIVNYRAFVNGIMLFFNEFEGDKRKVEKLKKKIASIYKYSRTEDYLNAFRNYVK